MGNNTLLLFLLSVVVAVAVVSILLFCFGIRFWCVHFWQTSWMWPHGQRVLCLLHAWGPIKSKQIIDTYADCLCVRVWVCADRIAFEMRTLSYSKICSNGIFCPICSLSDLHCRRKQQGEPKRNFTIFSTIWNSLRTPPQPQRVFVLAQFR